MTATSYPRRPNASSADLSSANTWGRYHARIRMLARWVAGRGGRAGGGASTLGESGACQAGPSPGPALSGRPRVVGRARGRVPGPGRLARGGAYRPLLQRLARCSGRHRQRRPLRRRHPQRHPLVGLVRETGPRAAARPLPGSVTTYPRNNAATRPRQPPGPARPVRQAPSSSVTRRRRDWSRSNRSNDSPPGRCQRRRGGLRRAPRWLAPALAPGEPQ